MNLFHSHINKQGNRVGLELDDDLLSSLLDHSLQGTIILKGNPPRIHYANLLACRLLGPRSTKGNAMAGEPILKHIHPQDRDDFRRCLSACHEQKTASVSKELRFVSPERKVTWVVYKGAFISHQGLPAILLQFLDMTEIKQAFENHKQIKENLESQVLTYQAACRTHKEEMNRKEEELLQKQQELAEINTNLLETNRAIATLARNMEMARLELERDITQKVKIKILPIIAGIKKAPIPESITTEMNILETQLKALVSREAGEIGFSGGLTGTELRVATMIKNGLNSSQIAKQLSVSQDTVKTHRRNIRRKFNLQNKGIRLPTFLLEKMEGKVYERMRNYGG